MKEEINNIQMHRIEEIAGRARTNGGSAPLERKMEGTFSLTGSPMFSAHLDTPSSSYEEGSDEPALLGGRGVRPSPLTYMLFGILSCFASTLAIQCSLHNIVLKNLRVKGQLSYDVGPLVTDSEIPIMKELRIDVISDNNLSGVVEEARRKCPALNAIEKPLKTVVAQI